MFPWRSRKQLVIFVLVMIPLTAAALLIVRNVIPVATCFDRKQNQAETGVDCGGGCISCALKYPRPVKVYWARIVPVREDLYDVAAEIENPNELISSVDVEYEFSLYDNFGPVTKKTGKTFLYPQERTLVIEPGIQTTRLANHAEFRITRVIWQDKSDLGPKIVTERRDYHVVEDKGKKQSVLDVALFNSSPYDFAKVDVQVVVLDANQNLLGVNHLTVENFHTQSRRTLQSIWPQAFTRDVSIISVQPRVNIFDPQMILKPQ